MSLSYLEDLVNVAIAQGYPWEGSGDAAERAHLARLAKTPGVVLIGEIGFNSGLSSYAFLEANPRAHVVSFDLGLYGYVASAKAHIDATFPGRHTLILGNSLVTVPAFQVINSLKFDLIFVDGGHHYQVAKADLLNMRALATRETILVTDDLVPWKPWGVGPTRAWQEAIRDGVVIQEELVKDGEAVTIIAPPGDRSWAVGKYVME